MSEPSNMSRRTAVALVRDAERLEKITQAKIRHMRAALRLIGELGHFAPISQAHAIARLALIKTHDMRCVHCADDAETELIWTDDLDLCARCRAKHRNRKLSRERRRWESAQ